jgi:2-polyprenyl-3-methyl-5-hydroxy-6-metoxy-1,4-benzoquinol methylase
MPGFLEPDPDLLAEQRSYYRLRAPEYDDWWERRGQYDQGEEAARDWNAQVSHVASALTAFAPTGDVLELAGGTGWWTERLASTAASLTVVDASPEVLELNRRRVRRADVRYVVADLFEWQPETRYDEVFFSFWLSHVPQGLVASFWDLVRACLRPTGRVFLIDSGRDPANAPHEETGVQHRQLRDGSHHRVVKIHYEPAELEALLGSLGWDARIEATPLFVFGCCQPAAVNRCDSPGADGEPPL